MVCGGLNRIYREEWTTVRKRGPDADGISRAKPTRGSCQVRAVRELDRFAELRGYPCILVRDCGVELASNAVWKWQGKAKID